MKRTRIPMILAILMSVFLLSFLVGRATALRDREKQEKRNEIYSGKIFIPKEKKVSPAGAVAENVLKNGAAEITENTDNSEEKEVKENPPERMLFPSGKSVLSGYSQSAVYSKTMDDWRAHTGIDYAADIGSEVISAWDGKVTKIYKDKLWGYTVEVLHSGNLYSVYKNLDSKIKVKEGADIKKGQVIGAVGNSASVEKRENPHLHFELWTGGEPINPESYVY